MLLAFSYSCAFGRQKMTDPSLPPNPEPIQTPVWRQFWDQPTEPEALRDWTKGLTPGLIAMALWLPWVQGLAAGSLPFGGIRYSFLGALAGAWASVPLFLAAALVVRCRQKPVRQIVAEAFGPRVGSWVVLCTHGMVAMFILTIAIDTAADWYFRSLAVTGFVSYPPSNSIRFLTTITWALWVIPIGYGMLRIIAALMDYVPILIAAVLSGLFLKAIEHLQLGEISLIMPAPVIADSAKGFWNAFFWTFSYGSIIGLFAADWGMGLKRKRDLVLGGLTGLGIGLTVVAAMGLLCLATFGMPGTPVPTMMDIIQSLGRWPALCIGLLVGTYLAAPGVFASYHLLQDLRQVFPRVHHYVWLALKVIMIQGLIAARFNHEMMRWSAALSLVLLVMVSFSGLAKKPKTRL